MLLSGERAEGSEGDQEWSGGRERIGEGSCHEASLAKMGHQGEESGSLGKEFLE